VSFVIYVFKNSVAQNPREGAKRLGSAEETHGSEKFFRDDFPFPIPHSQFPKTQSQPIKSGVWRLFRLTLRPSGHRQNGIGGFTGVPYSANWHVMV